MTIIMKLVVEIALGSISLFTLSLVGMIVQAGGWDNFKLQYFHLTSVFYDQS